MNFKLENFYVRQSLISSQVVMSQHAILFISKPQHVPSLNRY